tara:strand:- start:2119 stop:2490 length:372 start_codon:yes stop_codon:yes gene_type:complete
MNRNQKFGLLFFIIFLCLSFFPFQLTISFSYIFFSIAIFFVIITILNLKLLRFLRNVWIKLGEYLGHIISPIVMGIVFFLIITPIGLVLKLIGKDLLRLKFDKKNNSYWIKRDKDINSMKKQY